MVRKAELDELIYDLLRGSPYGFETCEAIQEGVSYKRSIPKSFWLDEKKGYYGILGLKRQLKKSDMRKIHSEVVERIICEINKPTKKEMYADNFSRLFHALAILGVNKCDPRVPAINKDYMYNIAYDLWVLDDGKPSTYEFISNVACYSTEAAKRSDTDNLITGRRHTFS